MQWTGSPPIKYPDPADWDTITYGYDPGGRRIKKTIGDDYSLKYVYDGGNVIAEYDHDNFLLRKYIYGPGVDEPICMIDAVANDAEYYYHYDGLGSVVALSDSAGDTVQTYEYSVYGQVAAEDPNFLTNPYLFTGRRFDLETGLYYFRARYYNPHIGRFMQTDPVGYDDGINWYSYCGNNPLAWMDPSGLMTAQIEIPTICITDDPFNNPGGVSFTDIVKWWLNDVGFYDDEYSHWDFNSVSIDGNDFVIDFYCEDDSLEPGIDYSTYDVGDATVMAFNDIGRLDSRGRTVKMIMDSWFKACLAEDRWNWNPVDWYYDMLSHAVTPFRGQGGSDIIKKWYLGGEIYDNTEVNYVGFGFAAAHFLSPLNASWQFWLVNRNLPQVWNLAKYWHLAGADQRWFITGFALYPVWKL